MHLREITPHDVAQLVELNNANVPAVSPSDRAGMTSLIGLADEAVAAVDEADPGVVLGFILLMRPGVDYASENYRWFERRGTDFLYVDRIVVGDAAQNAGVGAALYASVFASARARGIAEVTCEVNVDPPNPGSLRFHGRLGFSEVGRQSTKGDSIVVALLAAGVSAG